MMHLVSSYIITSSCYVITIPKLQNGKHLAASLVAMFLTARGVTASAFKDVELFYIHCMSKEKLSVTLKWFSCVSLVCREAHVSYLENMRVRRKCLVPDVVENQSVYYLL